MTRYKIICCKLPVELENLDDMPNEDGRLEFEGVCEKCGRTFQLTVYEEELGEEDE